MCKVPQEPLTVICVQVEQILKLIKLHPHDKNVETNFAFGSGRIENRCLTISKVLSWIQDVYVHRVQNQSLQIESYVNRDRVIDQNSVIQTEGSQANLIGGTLHSFGVLARETDSRCHFRKVSAVCKSLTLKWKRNSRQTANSDIYTHMICDEEGSSIYILLSLPLFYHAQSTDNSFGKASHRQTNGEKEANY